jgi:hypothetical protein
MDWESKSMQHAGLGWAALSVGSILAVLLLALARFTADPEGRLFGATFGGIAACFALPFWVGYRGRLPFSLACVLALLGIGGVFCVNCWACRQSGTIYVHPLDHVYLLMFCLPGMVVVGCNGAAMKRR